MFTRDSTPPDLVDLNSELTPVVLHHTAWLDGNWNGHTVQGYRDLVEWLKNAPTALIGVVRDMRKSRLTAVVQSSSFDGFGVMRWRQ